MSDLHVICQPLSNRIVLSKTRTTKDGLTVLTSERPQEVTGEVLHAVATHFYNKIKAGGPDSIVFGLEDGRELWLTARIKDGALNEEEKQ